MYGYGDILRVDLTTEQVRREPIPEQWLRTYVGGEGINTRLFWEHFLRVDPRIDPRSPDNVLVIGLGPLGATGFGLGSKTKFTFKGVAYNMFGDSVSGGAFGPMLRWAGHDYLVITGRAKRPVILYIENDHVELRDAGPIWGKGTVAANEMIKGQVTGVETACIGPAGENLVGCASITVSEHRSAGRCGGGAVMGSKNLKAIAVRGTKGIDVYDPGAFFAAMTEMFDRVSALPIAPVWKVEGTLLVLDTYDQLGSNAFRNTQRSILPKEANELLRAEWYVKNLKMRPLSCSVGCATACSGFQKIRGHESPHAARYAGESFGKPEFLTVSAFGAGCDIRDYAAISHFHRVCDDYGIDLMEAGNTTALLMELWEKGLVGRNDIVDWLGEPVSFEWGSVAAVEKVIDAIALQQNKFGQWFCDGTYRGAQQLERIKGLPLTRYVHAGKGGSVINEEVRPFPIWLTNMAVASRGCDHMKAPTLMDKTGGTDVSMALLGRPEAGERFTATLKGAASAKLENNTAALNLLGLCLLVATFDPINITLDAYVPAYTALTGRQISAEALYDAGARSYNLQKAFNSRLGYTRKDDTVCWRWLNEPVSDGPGKGFKGSDFLEQCKDEYYEFKGWDQATGLQRRETLERLGLHDVADVLARENVLA